MVNEYTPDKDVILFYTKSPSTNEPVQFIFSRNSSQNVVIVSLVR